MVTVSPSRAALTSSRNNSTAASCRHPVRPLSSSESTLNGQSIVFVNNSQHTHIMSNHSETIVPRQRGREAGSSDHTPTHSATTGARSTSGSRDLRAILLVATVMLLLLLACAATSALARAAEHAAAPLHERTHADRVATFWHGPLGTWAGGLAHRVQADRPTEHAPGEHDVDPRSGGEVPSQHNQSRHVDDATILPVTLLSLSRPAGATPLFYSSPSLAVPPGNCRPRAPPRS